MDSSQIDLWKRSQGELGFFSSRGEAEIELTAFGSINCRRPASVDWKGNEEAVELGA